MSLAVSVSKTHKGAEAGIGGRYSVCKREREREKGAVKIERSGELLLDLYCVFSIVSIGRD